jgi:hypothetical protein
MPHKRARTILVVAALFIVLGALWSFAWRLTQRLSSQEQLLVGGWSDVGPPPRQIYFYANRTFSNQIRSKQEGLVTGQWRIVENILYIRQDSDSLLKRGIEEPLPIYKLTDTTLQLGNKQNAITLLRVPP